MDVLVSAGMHVLVAHISDRIWIFLRVSDMDLSVGMTVLVGRSSGTWMVLRVPAWMF